MLLCPSKSPARLPEDPFNMNGTWKLPGDKLAGLPAGTYDVKVTAKNSIGLVRTDSTTNELTVAGASGK